MAGPLVRPSQSDECHGCRASDHGSPQSSACARAPLPALLTFCLNPGQVPEPTRNWLLNELPILRQKGRTIFQLNAQDTTVEPVQIWPPAYSRSPRPHIDDLLRWATTCSVEVSLDFVRIAGRARYFTVLGQPCQSFRRTISKK